MRLIDADALMQNAEYKGKHDILTAYDVVAAPTVDAVPVVRCVDCVHCQYDAIYGDRWCDGRRVKPDGYCSYGKRKSDLSLGTDNSEPHVELEPISGEHHNRYHGELDVRNGKLTIYGSDRCVCCGAVVPEGRMVCPSCERRAERE